MTTPTSPVRFVAHPHLPAGWLMTHDETHLVFLAPDGSVRRIPRATLEIGPPSMKTERRGDDVSAKLSAAWRIL